MGFHKTRTKRLTVKWAILAGLLWAQFALAEHAHEHAVGEFSHACDICQHLDSGDSAVPDSVPARAIQMPALAAESAGVAIVSTEPFPHYSARASP